MAAAIRRRTDVKQDVYYLEMNFEALAKSTKKLKIAAGELSKFPEVRRDLALLVDKSVTFSSLRDAAFAAERKLLKSVSLFDVYEGDKLPEGKKSYALSFILEDKTRTLDERTIERVMATSPGSSSRNAARRSGPDEISATERPPGPIGAGRSSLKYADATIFQNICVDDPVLRCGSRAVLYQSRRASL